MFPELPANLAELTDDELAALAGEFSEIVRLAAREKDPETLAALSEGAETDQDVLDRLEVGVHALETIRAEQKSRADSEETFTATLDELAKRVADPDPAPDDGEGDGGDEGDTEGAPAETADTAEPVVAATKPVRRPLPLGRRNRVRPEAAEPDGAPLLAATWVYPHAEPGERLTHRRLAELLTDLANKGRGQMLQGQKMVVASATFDFPDERFLTKDGPRNLTKIANVNSPAALVASGGLCGPVENVYAMPDIESADHPVRDSLAQFRADRGGANIPTNPNITDYADAVGIVTAEDDTTGGTFAVKNCMRIECPTFNETQVDAIYRCVEVGNLTSRAYPELMDRVTTLVLANHARAWETLLLDGIKAGSTAVTPTNTASAGAVWELFYQAHVAAAGMRSRNRMRRDAAVRVLFPEWIIDELQVDIIRGPFQQYPGRDDIVRYLAGANINVTFYKDSPTTGTSQLFDAQTAGTLDAFPADVQWGIFPEGAWLHLDAGQLDLGVVRDSVLNSTNDLQIFAEAWAQVALQGVESNWITSTLCPNGTLSAPKDLSGICMA